MTRVIWAGDVRDLKVRIVKENGNDCVVEVSRLTDPDVHVDRHWEIVDDDGVAADVYMTAYLQAREAMAAIQKASCLDDFLSY